MPSRALFTATKSYTITAAASEQRQLKVASEGSIAARERPESAPSRRRSRHR
jgi:hypothetical protein